MDFFSSTALNASFDLYNNYVSMQYSGDQYSDFYAIFGEMGGLGPAIRLIFTTIR